TFPAKAGPEKPLIAVGGLRRITFNTIMKTFAKTPLTAVKTLLVSCLVLLMCLACCRQATAQGTAFTYQGQLKDNGGIASGHYDFEFWLFDSTNSPSTVVAG